MSFLVRKLNNRDKLTSLFDKECVEDIYADIPTTEFKTTNGSLSTWIIDSLEDLENAVLAIATSSTKISKMDFIVIDTDLLDKNELQYEQTYAGMNLPIPDLQDKHYDIIGISLKKLINCANVYKTILAKEPEDEERYIVRFTEPAIKEMLQKAIFQGRVNKSKASRVSKHIIEIIDKLSV